MEVFDILFVTMLLLWDSEFVTTPKWHSCDKPVAQTGVPVLSKSLSMTNLKIFSMPKNMSTPF